MRFAQAYLKAIDSFRTVDLPTLYRMYQQGALEFPATYALLYPKFYETSGLQQLTISGQRNFARITTRKNERCMSHLLWGYECPHLDSGEIHADHLFPYGLGGITDARNQIYLCRTHNLTKGHDIHIYPWENGQQGWVSEAINKIIRYLPSK